MRHRSTTQYYCAITPLAEHHALAAIKIMNQQIIFSAFHCAPLTSLAKQFHTHGLVIGVPDEYLDLHTHFFSMHDSPATIYRSIANKASTLQSSSWFDYAAIEHTEQPSEEQLIISYHLRDDALLKPYQQLGFVFSALEPLSSAKKRALRHPWQEQARLHAQKYFDDDAAELTLKLLDRENFLCLT